MIPLPPDTWHAIGPPALGGLPVVGLLGQVSLLQTIATLSAAGVLTTIGLGVKWLIENRQKTREANRQAEDKTKEVDRATQEKARKDTLAEWQEYAQKLEGNVARLESELAESRREVVKANGVVGQLRVRLQSSRGRIALLTQALGLREQGVDPFILQQMEMRAQAVIVTRPDGVITDAAPNIIAIIDYDHDELRNMNFARLIPARFRERHRVFMEKALDLSIPMDHKAILPLLLRTRGGQEQPVNIRVRRTEVDGKITRFSALVTERDFDADDGNGSQSGDSGAFLRAGDPAAQAATAEMKTIAGAGEAGAKGGAA